MRSHALCEALSPLSGNTVAGGGNATDQFGSKRLLHQLTQLVHYLRNIEIKIKTKIVIHKTIFVINIIIYTCNILMFCEFKIAVYLSLREKICSPKEFAP